MLHLFYYQFILTDFMAATSEQNVFISPYLRSFLAKFKVTVEVIDSNIIDKSKQSDVAIKRDLIKTPS